MREIGNAGTLLFCGRCLAFELKRRAIFSPASSPFNPNNRYKLAQGHRLTTSNNSKVLFLVYGTPAPIYQTNIDMFKTNNNLITSRVETAKRIQALVVTGLCVFILSCMIWSLTVSEFRSIATINLAGDKDVQSKVELEQLLAQAIEEETSNQQLEAIVSRIEMTGDSGGGFPDFDSLRKKLQVSFTEREFGYEFRLGFDGNGGDNERKFIELLATRIANQLKPEDGFGKAKGNSSKQLAESISRLESMQVESCEAASWIVDQIENDLKTIKFTLAQMGHGSNRNANSSSAVKGVGAQFQFASNSRVVEDSNKLTSTVESIDLQSLRGLLNEMRQRIDVQSKLIEGASLQRQTTGLVVSSKTGVTSLPTAGFPGNIWLWLLGLASTVFGSVVAVKMNPFESRGFENARAIGRKLGVPVVAQIRSDSSPSGEITNNKNVSWANRVATGSGFILFGALVVFGGFLLANPEIRFAFLENPLSGIVKTIWMLAGH